MSSTMASSREAGGRWWRRRGHRYRQPQGFGTGQVALDQHRVVKQKFLPDARMRDGLEELTLRAGEIKEQTAFFEDATRIEDTTWSPLLVDSDWSALCQTMNVGVEQEDWVTIYDALSDGIKEGGTTNELALDAE